MCARQTGQFKRLLSILQRTGEMWSDWNSLKILIENFKFRFKKLDLQHSLHNPTPYIACSSHQTEELVKSEDFDLLDHLMGPARVKESGTPSKIAKHFPANTKNKSTNATFTISNFSLINFLSNL